MIMSSTRVKERETKTLLRPKCVLQIDGSHTLTGMNILKREMSSFDALMFSEAYDSFQQSVEIGGVYELVPQFADFFLFFFLQVQYLCLYDSKKKQISNSFRIFMDVRHSPSSTSRSFPVFLSYQLRIAATRGLKMP